MSRIVDSPGHRGKGTRLPLTLVALVLPGGLFGVGLLLVRDHPRFAWLASVGRYPWEFWLLLASGVVATAAGVADWRFHRSGKAMIGRREHLSELLALAGGG